MACQGMCERRKNSFVKPVKEAISKDARISSACEWMVEGLDDFAISTITYIKNANHRKLDDNIPIELLCLVSNTFV